MTNPERHIEIIACPKKETGPENIRNSEGTIIELKEGPLSMAYSNSAAGAHDVAVSDIRLLRLGTRGHGCDASPL